LEIWYPQDLTDLTKLSKVLKNAPNLEQLDLSSNPKIQLGTLQWTSEMNHLKILNLRSCGLRDLTELKKLLAKTPNLEHLDLSWNFEIQLETLQLTSEMNHLKILDLRYCGLTDRSALNHLFAGHDLEILT
jgi:Leucine-rich repeat (LRR) protein